MKIVHNMVLVSHRYKFIYLKNAKVAGSSVEKIYLSCTILHRNIDFVIKDDIELVGAYGGKTEFGEVFMETMDLMQRQFPLS